MTVTHLASDPIRLKAVGTADNVRMAKALSTQPLTDNGDGVAMEPPHSHGGHLNSENGVTSAFFVSLDQHQFGGKAASAVSKQKTSLQNVSKPSNILKRIESA